MFAEAAMRRNSIGSTDTLGHLTRRPCALPPSGSFGRVVCKGATNSRHDFVSPFQGFFVLRASQPRPLAWADLCDASGVSASTNAPNSETGSDRCLASDYNRRNSKSLSMRVISNRHVI
jgi:hypothetical protein